MTEPSPVATATYRCPPASVHVEGTAARVVFGIDGEIDLSNSEAVRAVLHEHITREQDQVVIDLSSVGYLDSASLHVLTEIGQFLGIRRQELVLVAPPHCPAHAILTLSGLTSSFTVVATR